jgi:septal ring factor EnvC (AmiA/AmiB activator)
MELRRHAALATSIVVAVILMLTSPTTGSAGQRRKAANTATAEQGQVSRTLTVHQKVLAGLRTQIADLTTKVDSLQSKLIALSSAHDQTRKGVASILQAIKDPAANRPLEYAVKSVELGRVPAYLNEMGKAGWRLSHTEEYATTDADGKPVRATRVYMERHRTSASTPSRS